METNGFDNGKRMGLRTKNIDKGGGTDSDFDGGKRGESKEDAIGDLTH